jgi:transcriptional regulator with XRE-family HTH domain
MSAETQCFDIASNVRRLRKARGLTQRWLAERSGLWQSWGSRLERQADNPSIATLQRLASGLRVPVQDLLRAAAGDRTP